MRSGLQANELHPNILVLSAVSAIFEEKSLHRLYLRINGITVLSKCESIITAVE